MLLLGAQSCQSLVGGGGGVAKSADERWGGGCRNLAIKGGRGG